MSSSQVDKTHKIIKRYFVSKKTYFRKWLDKQPRGTASDIAESLGVTRQYVYKISSDDTVLSIDRAKQLSKLTGLELSRFSYFQITVHKPNG